MSKRYISLSLEKELELLNTRMDYWEMRNFPVDIFLQGNYIIIDMTKVTEPGFARGESRLFFKYFEDFSTTPRVVIIKLGENSK